MTIRKQKAVISGGKKGKTYPTKKQALKQARAIYASEWRENKKKK